MIAFLIGMVIGALVAVSILGFLAVVTEDEENKRHPPGPWEWYNNDGR